MRTTLGDMWLLNLHRDAEDTSWKAASITAGEGVAGPHLSTGTAFQHLLPTEEESFLVTEGEDLETVHEFVVGPDGEASECDTRVHSQLLCHRW